MFPSLASNVANFDLFFGWHLEAGELGRSLTPSCMANISTVGPSHKPNASKHANSRRMLRRLFACFYLSDLAGCVTCKWTYKLLK